MHTTKIIKEYKGRQRLTREILVKYIAPLLSVYVTDLEILVVLVTRLLKRDLDRLVNGMEPVEP
jgi:hypothetical protein